MSIKPWKIIESSYFHPQFRMDKCELPNGKLINASVFEFRPWVNVLAMTKDSEVVLIRQYRHGVQDVLWEFPGGVMEDDEDPLEGAKREMLEETGYTSPNIVQVGKFYPNPAIQTDTMYSFLALDAEKTDGQNLDDAEEIEIHLVPLDEVIEMTKRGEFCHALQIAALFHALAYLERIR
jgi:8-oxo-dGTP pyrophosphatase MutT (NUDIX family)